MYGAGRRVGQPLSDVTLSWIPPPRWPSRWTPRWTLLCRCLRSHFLFSCLLWCVRLTVVSSLSFFRFPPPMGSLIFPRVRTAPTGRPRPTWDPLPDHTRAVLG